VGSAEKTRIAVIRKPAWIAIVIFIVLAALTLFLEKRGDSLPFNQKTSTPTIYKVVLHSENEITRVTLKTQDQEIVVIKDTNLGWKVISPANNADGAGIFQEKLSEILSLKVYRLLSSNTSDELLGLNKQPTLDILLEYSGGQKDTIIIGAQTPIESGYYARLQNGEAVILNKISVENILDIFNQFFATPTPLASETATVSP
jgi:hypothetical protein